MKGSENMLLNETELTLCKNAISKYIEDEFGDEFLDGLFDDLTNIGLNHTTLTNEQIPIQVSLNLVDMKLMTWIGDLNNSPDSLVEEKFVDVNWLINWLDADSMLAGWEDYIEQHMQEYVA